MGLGARFLKQGQSWFRSPVWADLSDPSHLPGWQAVTFPWVTGRHGAWLGKVVWNSPLTSSLGAFKNEFPGKEDSQALGRILGRVSRVCSDLTNASRNHPAVCVPAVLGAVASSDAASAESSSQGRGVCFKAFAKPQWLGGMQRRAHPQLCPSRSNAHILSFSRNG